MRWIRDVISLTVNRIRSSIDLNIVMTTHMRVAQRIMAGSKFMVSRKLSRVPLAHCPQSLPGLRTINLREEGGGGMRKREEEEESREIYYDKENSHIGL